MDIRTLAMVLQEANRLLPQEVREQIADVLDKGAAVLNEFGDAFDEATMNSQAENREEIWATYADNIKSEPAPKNPKVTFEDIVKGWEGTPAAKQPDAGSGGREGIRDIINSIYDYVASNSDEYVAPNEDNRAWNQKYPAFIVVDFLQMLANDEVERIMMENERDDEKEV